MNPPLPVQPLSGLHILMVPAWWPAADRPYAGIFNVDYAEVFASAGAKVGVVYPDLIGFRRWKRDAATPWRPVVSRERLGDVSTIRIEGRHCAFRLPIIQMRRYLAWLRRGLGVYQQHHGEPDVVHASCCIPSGWAATRLPAHLGRRTVITEHSSGFDRLLQRGAGGGYVRAALRHAAAVVAVSDGLRNDIRRSGVERAIEVCGNPINPAFLGNPHREPRAPGPVRGLFVGRLVPEKGVPELLNAIEQFDATTPLEWRFLGDGPLAPAIAAAFQASGRSDTLRELGARSRTDVVQRMREADFLVLPTHGETFGATVAEALCVGLPVITTRGTNCAAFLSSDDGLLVEKEDPDGLAAAIRTMLGQLDRYDRAAIATRAAARFDNSRIAAHYARIFRSIL